MDFQDLVDTPQKIKTLAGTVAFLVIFPVYFAAMPSLIDEDLVGGGSSGLVGTLSVSFEESEISLTESVVLGDGESHDTFFDLMAEMEVFVGYVELAVSCFDNDDPGPGFTDSVEGTSDLNDLDGLEDQTAEGQCSGGDGGFTIRWDLTENYSGEGYTEENENEDEIRERWNDGGLGRGTWAATITADISSPPAPIVGQIIDSDEEFDVTWTAVTFTVVIISS
ncbi:MAG: hypothetical protein QGF28_01680 [Candidatus Thalassarchaeaceae archaeon]|jgi:hypothetical protein|nr:hypothetical protein [Euryarchaeota archaeon]MDP6221053.1 hypothetical protein [Candidatus Thalassarchaeaceae archaeon]MDP7091857.1 hypothetical protein [Candidatus Thalassarchaeaceae archaeon]MDP7256454.1 hypothetical protein [Candidatus Thalassarchaeaceae archaeon]MDP7445904.1 hypothetical protein [Candidatus Thalassarchaeaceae archaeon]|tara:strand:+ start:892 stop:1560 length:669 start_codon:yes stop_codon:yes gene_type:complete